MLQLPPFTISRKIHQPEIRSNLGSNIFQPSFTLLHGRENSPPAMFFWLSNQVLPGRFPKILYPCGKLRPCFATSNSFKSPGCSKWHQTTSFKHGGFTTGKITESTAYPGFIKISIITSPSLYSQYLAIILRINPHSIPTKSKVFDSFWWWIPCKHNNISWTHSNTSEIPYVRTILHGESHQNYRRIPMKSPWCHGAPTDATLGRSNCSDQVDVDPTVLIWISIGANVATWGKKSNENGSWRSWKGITLQIFFRFWSVSICFDLLIWFEKWWDFGDWCWYLQLICFHPASQYLANRSSATCHQSYLVVEPPFWRIWWYARHCGSTFHFGDHIWTNPPVLVWSNLTNLSPWSMAKLEQRQIGCAYGHLWSLWLSQYDRGHVKGIQIQMIRSGHWPGKSRLQECFFFAVKPYRNEAKLRHCWLVSIAGHDLLNILTPLSNVPSFWQKPMCQDARRRGCAHWPPKLSCRAALHLSAGPWLRGKMPNCWLRPMCQDAPHRECAPGLPKLSCRAALRLSACPCLGGKVPNCWLKPMCQDAPHRECAPGLPKLSCRAALHLSAGPWLWGNLPNCWLRPVCQDAPHRECAPGLPKLSCRAALRLSAGPCLGRKVPDRWLRPVCQDAPRRGCAHGLPKLSCRAALHLSAGPLLRGNLPNCWLRPMYQDAPHRECARALPKLSWRAALHLSACPWLWGNLPNCWLRPMYQDAPHRECARALPKLSGRAALHLSAGPWLWGKLPDCWLRAMCEDAPHWECAHGPPKLSCRAALHLSAGPWHGGNLPNCWLRPMC